MRLKCVLLLPFVLGAILVSGGQSMEPTAPAATPDVSKEAYVVEHLVTKIVVEDDGSGVREVNAEIKILSDAGLKAFAVLSFTYTSANEVVDVEDVSVRKPDGSVIRTPDYNVQEMPADITRTAPMYSDVREKHVAVKGLGVGDTLEYKVRFRVLKPEIAGQFWYEHSFSRDQVVRNEQVELSIPKSKHLTVKSPEYKPEVKEEGPRKVYAWRFSNPVVKERELEELPNPRRGTPPPAIQVTTFSSWEDIGRWYYNLQKDQVSVTPEIQAKAGELTKGLATDDEKLSAIYRFVSVGIHYIGLDFGIGRYQPHSADEVLGNQYGDCKDKHTLLAALLKAAGYQAWPALIHAAQKLDAEVPSPGQFNHVITVVPLGDRLIWLDTTPEVAPYQLLLPVLRDKQALVIPIGKPPVLLTTPADPPFPQEQHFSVVAKLGADGILNAHIVQKYRGDSEVLMRTVFRQTPQSRWKELMQRLSYVLGFGGEVSNVTASPTEDLSRPFEVSYDYLRKDYADWEHRQVLAVLPPFGIESAANRSEKVPKEAIYLGGPGELLYESQLELPVGDTVFAPNDLDLVESFAEYHSKNQVENGALKTTRRLVLKKSEVPLSDWNAYKKLAKSVSDDESNYLRLIGAEDGVVSALASLKAREGAPVVEQKVPQTPTTKQTVEVNVGGDKNSIASKEVAVSLHEPGPDLDELRRTVQADLREERFDELDRLADQYLRERSRLPGGGWLLRAFYGDLDIKLETDQQATDHLAHLEHWMKQRHESIAARIALANSLQSWAWLARGTGFADKVTDEGWRNFNDRIAKAEAVLESVSGVINCPELYFSMMKIGRSQGWDAGRMKKAFERGIQLEPEYQFLYREYANYLLPKWYGKEGDSPKFAKASADQIGGDAGDILYFQIAMGLITRGNRDLDATMMDWQRIQRGYKGLSAKYGVNSNLKNQLAYMACRFKDAAIARQQFAAIDEDWAREVWGERKWFDQYRDWAKAH
jgi:transglutaminase-like putative cysteine protease